MFKSTGITGAYEPPYIIILRCECGNAQMVSTDNFEVIKDEYLTLKDDIEITCPKCGKIHTDKVICKEQQTFSHLNIPKCPTCGSTNVSKIPTASKVVGFATVGIYSSNFSKSFRCGNCGYNGSSPLITTRYLYSIISPTLGSLISFQESLFHSRGIFIN